MLTDEFQLGGTISVIFRQTLTPSCSSDVLHFVNIERGDHDNMDYKPPYAEASKDRAEGRLQMKDRGHEAN